MFGLLTLPFQLLLLLVVLILLGIMFRGKVWSPSFTVAKKFNFKMTIAVPQVAFFFTRLPAPASAAAPAVAPAATNGATVEKK